MKKIIATVALLTLFAFLIATALQLHPFGEPKKDAYLFSLSPEYKQHIKDGLVNATLKQVFYDRNICLSDDAYISTLDAKNWKITDRNVDLYKIEDTGVKLKIYTLVVMDNYFIKNAQNETGANNVVTSIVFDYRGYDTLGEATVLFTAVTGVGVLFRRLKKEKEK